MIHIQTPVYENPIINQRLNKHIYFKMECYQPTGSFKARGIGFKCQQAVKAGKKHLISSSGGNAGYSAAYAGRVLGVQVTVVVPKTTLQMARDRMHGEGAQVIEHGTVWDEANTYASQLADEVNGALIPAFDDEQVWEGHATLVDEAADQCPKPDVLIVSVGGAGLLCGVLQGMHRNGWHNIPVMTIETNGADSFGQTVKAGRLITLPAITSIANTLGSLRVTARALEWAKQHDITPQVVTDKQAVNACLKFADDMRVVVEPACGASLSVIYDNQHLLAGYESAFIIVCGGAGVTLAQLKTWARTLD